MTFLVVVYLLHVPMPKLRTREFLTFCKMFQNAFILVNYVFFFILFFPGWLQVSGEHGVGQDLGLQ